MTTVDNAATDLILGEDRWSVAQRGTQVSSRRQLEADVLAGLQQDPPTLPARWFYDERGSVLFDDITRLPEYYPTRRETEILTARAAEIEARTRATTLIELGSGTSTKTRLLLDALAGEGQLTFVPIDVSAEILTDAARSIAGEYPSVTVHAIVGDFDSPFGELPGLPGHRLVAFLGGTVGNFDDVGRGALFSRIRDALDSGDHFLIGADLKKDPQRLVAAYDDSAGVTAEFNRNLIEVLRRELEADGLTPEDFEHVARWNATQGRIEMWLRATRDIHARFPTLDLNWDLQAGKEMLTEISVKFDLPVLHHELAAAGFDVVRAWTDDDGDFSLTLAKAV
jgi:L-histidine Nalpha-methyltransferase